MKNRHKLFISLGIAYIGSCILYLNHQTDAEIEVTEFSQAASQNANNGTNISDQLETSLSAPQAPPQGFVDEQALSHTSGSYTEFEKNRPNYLKNTELRGDFIQSEDGFLIITEDIRKRFDYFFMMAGDQPIADIQAVIIDHIRQTLKEPAQSQALGLLDNYIAYLNEYDTFTEGLSANVLSDDPLWVSEEIKRMRRFYLGDETSLAFFDHEEALRESALQHSTNKNEKNTKPPRQLSSSQEQTLSLVLIQEETELLKTNGADNTAIHQMRVERLGEAAANRLAVLDKSRQQWQEKQAAYHELKEQWRGISGFSNNDRELEFESQAKTQLELLDSDLKRLKALHYIQKNQSI